MHPYGTHGLDCYGKSWHGRQCTVGDNTGNNIKQPFIDRREMFLIYLQMCIATHTATVIDIGLILYLPIYSSLLFIETFWSS